MIAVITAGGRVDKRFASRIDTGVKAMAPLVDRLLIDVALDAAEEAGAERIAIVGPKLVQGHCARRADLFIEADADGRVNVHRALTVDAGEDLLLLTSDLPFVTGAAIRTFLARARNTEMAMPICTEAEYTAVFPHAPAHAAAIGGRRIVNGSVFYFRSSARRQADETAQRFFAARKSLRRMAALAGPVVLGKYLLGTLRVEDVERRAARVLKVQARAIDGSAPSLCYDIDTLGDYEDALRRLSAG